MRTGVQRRLQHSARQCREPRQSRLGQRRRLPQTSASGPIFWEPRQRGLRHDQSSSLESSTVDLATELTNMIQAQSAYEANSKVFQTGANIFDVLNGLKP